MEIICIDKRIFDELIVRLSEIEKKVTRLCSPARDAGLKKWMDNRDVCEVLRISKRTLQVYREKGLLPYTRIKNKIFYRPEDVQKQVITLKEKSHELRSY